MWRRAPARRSEFGFQSHCQITSGIFDGWDPFPASLGCCTHCRRRRCLEHGAVLHATIAVRLLDHPVLAGPFGGGLIAAILVLMQGPAGLREFSAMGSNGWLVALHAQIEMLSFDRG
jgi:hypothetical protein